MNDERKVIIKLTPGTHAELKHFARKDETFNDVIKRLLKGYVEKAVKK